MKIYSTEELIQQSPEWFALRDLKLTSSEATAIGNWNNPKTKGAGLISLCKRLVREHKMGRNSNFSNFHTDRGNEYEEIARELYELETGRRVKEVGFIELDEFTGCSTDGLIGDDGLAEIKSLDDPAYFDVFMEEKIPSDYLWQCNMEILVTGRKWADLIFYSPNCERTLSIFRIHPDPLKQEALRKGIENGKRLIREYLALYDEKLKDTTPKVIGEEPEDEVVIAYEGNKKTGAFTIPRTYAPKKKK